MDIELSESIKPVYELREVVKSKTRKIWFYTKVHHFKKVVYEHGIYNFTKEQQNEMIKLFNAFEDFYVTNYKIKRMTFPSFYFILRNITDDLGIKLEMNTKRFPSFRNHKFVQMWEAFILDPLYTSYKEG